MKKYLLFLLLFIAIELKAQSKLTSNLSANYKLADRFLPANVDPLVGTIEVKPNFINETDNFWYSYKTKNGTTYYYVEPSKKRVEKLFDNAELITQMSKVSPKSYKERDLNINPVFSKDGKSFSITIDTTEIIYTLRTKSYKLSQKIKHTQTATDSSMQTLNRKAMLYSLSNDSLYAVYAKNHNLWVKQMRDSDTIPVQLTNDGEQLYSYSHDAKGSGDGEFTPKINWLKKSYKFYSLREDDRKMTPLPILDCLAVGRPKVREYTYYMPSDKDVVQYDLIIGDAQTQKVMKIDLTKWQDQKVIVLEATSDGKKLFIERKRRTCDELEVCVIDTETGELEVLINEVCKPYFNESLHSIAFLNDGEEILWWSERSGWGHYYLYDGKGKLRRELTSGEWIAGNIEKIDTLRRTLYINGYAKEDGVIPYYAMLYKIDMDGKTPIKRLTSPESTHKTVMSKSGNYFIDNYSRVDLNPGSLLRDNHGKVVVELGETDLSRLYETGWRMPELFTVKAADGVTDLYGVMWKPFDFDSTKCYPIISYVYPGPQTEAVPFDFTVTGKSNLALSQVGFIVISVGHRGGSPLRNKSYRTYGYGNLRDYPLADDKYAIEQLADRYKFIDIDRVGIYGHSGGGFMSTAAICTYPNFYKVAVSSSGNHNNNQYNRWWGESHHGVKETIKKDKDGKDVSTFSTKIATNMELAKNLKGHLLLITGDIDENVHPAHTLQMINALINSGKNFDMYILPGQRHRYQGAAEVFYNRKLWYYFGKHLLGDDKADSYYDIEQYKK